jgi:hypothetical protein
MIQAPGLLYDGGRTGFSMSLMRFELPVGQEFHIIS